MTRTEAIGSSRVTGVRVATLSVLWVGVAYLAGSMLGIYYEALAALYTIPILLLAYAYCLSHRGRPTAVLAIVATIVVVLIIGASVLIPKGSAV
jgi:uncharacterized membrane protein